MSKIENLSNAGYITKTGLIGTDAESWSIDEMFDNQTITLTGLDPEVLAEIAKDQVAEPTFSYDAKNDELTVSCLTDGAEIYVMIDNEPYELYNGPIDTTKVYTVIAQAKKEGYKDSNTSLWEKLI